MKLPPFDLCPVLSPRYFTSHPFENGQKTCIALDGIYAKILNPHLSFGDSRR